MRYINQFWNSNITACVYGSDQPQVRGNAVSHGGTGYIYYDPDFLLSFLTSTGSYLPPAIVLAHETGHEIQGRFNTQQSLQIRNELGADCYAGYFLGWLECNGTVSMRDIMAEFQAACSSGSSLPWWDPQAHGTCTDRQTAVMRGVAAFQGGTAPLVACTF